MHPEIKEAWLAKLRSGDYSKGIEVLRDLNDNYCCLGVLCDLYREQTGIGEWVKGASHYTFRTPVDEDFGLLPESVYTWAGLDCDDPVVENKTPVATLNDDKFGFDEDFTGIAEVLEEGL